MGERRFVGRGDGVALVMVIWVLTALAVILSEFVFAGRVGLNAARNQREDAAGYYLAVGAYYLALDEIRQPYSYLLRGEDGGVVFVKGGEAEPRDLSATLRTGTLPGAGKYFYQLSDEESKMNLNKIGDRRQLLPLLRAAGLEIGAERDAIIDSILDWRDADNLHRLNGAEDDYYQSLTPPYYAKNGNFSTVRELLLVKGVSRRLFYGAPGKEGEAPPPALYGMLSVHGERPNLNTAPRDVLLAWFNGDEAMTDRHIRERPHRDGTGKSFFFTVYAEGRPEGAETGRKISAVVNRRDDPHGKASELVVLQWDDCREELSEEAERAR